MMWERAIQYAGMASSSSVRILYTPLGDDHASLQDRDRRGGGDVDGIRTGVRAEAQVPDPRHPETGGWQAEPGGAGAENGGRETGHIWPLAHPGHLHREHREGSQ